MERHLGALVGNTWQPSPDVALLAAAGRGNVNGEPMQGSLAGFIATEVDLIRPGKVALCHHDKLDAPSHIPNRCRADQA